ncbi:hypothetical protein [Amycolatopsis pithecellobii]|uniref:Uncharacterized protein n=1 Tax=Amycolatopsis pithecellobii TaxID=664692 RepID=A0A6N7YVR0_9PSEU|nr:hypothetical protein [Amycolatopsis pithecellobii]MTD57155.1 hypothetical protein [Amycolatopsis pithecellobii]
MAKRYGLELTQGHIINILIAVVAKQGGRVQMTAEELNAAAPNPLVGNGPSQQFSLRVYTEEPYEGAVPPRPDHPFIVEIVEESPSTDALRAQIRRRGRMEIGLTRGHGAWIS